jgi:hypothetical protein
MIRFDEPLMPEDEFAVPVPMDPLFGPEPVPAAPPEHELAEPDGVTMTAGVADGVGDCTGENGSPLIAGACLVSYA